MCQVVCLSRHNFRELDGFFVPPRLFDLRWCTVIKVLRFGWFILPPTWNVNPCNLYCYELATVLAIALNIKVRVSFTQNSFNFGTALFATMADKFNHRTPLFLQFCRYESSYQPFRVLCKRCLFVLRLDIRHVLVGLRHTTH